MTLFYTSTGSLILSSVIVVLLWEDPSSTQLLFLFWLGFFGAMGQFFMINAFEKASAFLLAPFDYVTLIWSILFGFCLFGDLPNTWMILGVAIIVSSGFYLMKLESNTPTI